MPAPRKYPDELRERAVRLVREDGERGALARVVAQLDINPETLRNWVKADRRRTEQPETVAGSKSDLPGCKESVTIT